VIINWPRQNYENGVEKNATTGRRFKALVRILKRLRNEMLANGHQEAGPIPSYLIECLVWNVPNEGFGHDAYRDDVRYALAHLWNETRSDDTCSEWGGDQRTEILFSSRTALGPRPGQHLSGCSLELHRVLNKMASIRYVKAILYVAVAVWAIVLFGSGQSLSSALLRPFSTVTSFVVLLAINTLIETRRFSIAREIEMELHLRCLSDSSLHQKFAGQNCNFRSFVTTHSKCSA
jgi:hypothetical protein